MSSNKDRRAFFKKAGVLSAATLLSPYLLQGRSFPEELVRKLPTITNDEMLWKWVQNSYTVSATISNLNNGGVSPQPKVVQEMFEYTNRMFNETPSRFMWSSQGKMESVREKLADLAGCSADEIAINRNTTEAMNTVIWGIDLQKGDEVVLTEQDYSTVMRTWDQRQKRHGIVLNYISFSLPIENTDLIVKKYTEAVTSKTKAVMITHVNNLNGNIMPVRAIADAVKKKNPNILVIVDGAHAFAHLDFNISDLNCDYYGASLHKWLCAPFGNGLLYVKKNRIASTWQLFPFVDPQSDDIRKFETIGTRMLPAELSIARAIEFHETIGSKRKQDRLFYLKNYWMEKVAKFPNVIVQTSFSQEFSGALGAFSLKNMKLGDIGKRLMNDYHIHTSSKADRHGKYTGMRITPHVYTKISELDRFVAAVKDLSEKS